MAQTSKTAVKFSGLQDYPNSLSDVQPGALQIANHVVLDKPGVISPRRGQRVYSQTNLLTKNLLTANQATGTDTLGDTTGFSSVRPDAAGFAASNGTVATSTAQAKQGTRSLLFAQTSAVTLAGPGGTVALPVTGIEQATFMFSVWARAVSGTPAVKLYVRGTGGTSATGSPVTLSSTTWTELTLSFTNAVGDTVVQFAVAGPVSAVTSFYIDELQIEENVVATAWALPGPAVCSRLFQADTTVFGLFGAGGTSSADGVLQRVDAGQSTSTAASGLLAPPPANAMRSAEAHSNVYLATDDGIQKLMPQLTGGSSGQTVPAGMPFGLDVQAQLASPGASLGFLAGDHAVAYRVVFGNSDAAGNLILGAPSPAVTVANPLHTNVGSFLPHFKLVPTAAVFSVTLGFTAQATAVNVPCFVVQGSQVSPAFANFTATSTAAVIELLDSAFYFGPAGSPVSLVFALTAAAVATNTDLTVVDSAGNSATPVSWLPTAGTGAVVVYQPYNVSAPASTSAATNQAAVASASANHVHAATGTWTAGSIGLVANAVVLAVQPNTLVFNGDATAVILVHDQLSIANAVGTFTVSTVVYDGGNNVTYVTLLAYPTDADVSGVTTSVTIARPQDVQLTFTVPKEAQVYAAAGLSTFYQMYRSAVQAPLNGVATGAASDSMQLAYQGDVSASDTQITFTDIAPDGTLGAALYTSPQQEGIGAAKYPPPVASDMCLYQDTMLYANAWLPASGSFTLLGVSSTNVVDLNSLQPGDIITINGVNFTASYPAPSGSHPFLISVGSGSVTADINATVANLSKAVNQAFVAPTSPGSPNESVVLISTADPTSMGGTFVVQVSRGLGTFTWDFTPAPTYPHQPFVGATGTYEPTQQQNALYCSADSEPEAVPLLRQLLVGQANTPIQRVLPLASSCVIFKPEGIYQLSGTSFEQFSISLLNTTAQLLANETAVLLQSSVVAYTNQGVITVSQGGVQITSMAINDTLLGLAQLPNFGAVAFAVAHEEARRFILFAPTTAADTVPTQAFAYNILTNAWTAWPTLTRTCGIADRTTQKLLLGATDTAATALPGIYAETQAGQVVQYGDDVATGTVHVIDATTCYLLLDAGYDATQIAANFPDGTALVTAQGTFYVTGMASYLGGTAVSFTVPSSAGFVTASGTLIKPTLCSFAPVPIAGSDPGIIKQFQEFEVAFVNTTCPNVSATCQTDWNSDPTALPLTVIGIQTALGYGSGAWGSFSWGTGAPAVPVLTQNARQLVARGATWGHYFWPLVSASVAGDVFNAEGLTLGWTPGRSLRSR